jgi:hypothetical protein
MAMAQRSTVVLIPEKRLTGGSWEMAGGSSLQFIGGMPYIQFIGGDGPLGFRLCTEALSSEPLELLDPLPVGRLEVAEAGFRDSWT